MFSCNEIIETIVDGSALPEYVLFSEVGDKHFAHITVEICKATLESMKRDGKQLYSLEKSFDVEMELDDFWAGYPKQRVKHLFHLDTATFQPY